MRLTAWLAAICAMLTTCNLSFGQQNTSLSSFLTGANQQQMQSQPVDTSTALAPVPQRSSPLQPIQPSTSAPLSLRGLLPNITIPTFGLTKLFTPHNAPGPVLPGQHPDAYGPVLPTDTLPAPIPNAYNPVVPPQTLPPPQYPNAFQPLPPIPAGQ